MGFSISLIVAAVFGAVGLFGLAQAVLKIPMPQKSVWTLGFGILAANGVCNALYQYGGVYIILMPALIPLQAATETTATLALLIGAYSAMNKDVVSSHWYSLPTGCAPIGMLAQYFPTYYLQAGFFAIFMTYVLLKNRSGKVWVLPFGLAAGSTAVKILGFAVPGVLSTDDLVSALLAASTFILVLLSTGMSVTIGKTKIG